MGWCGRIARHFKANGTVDKKAECEALFENWPEHEILKSSIVGNVFYAAIKNKLPGKEEVFAVVTLTDIVNYHKEGYKEFQYKDMGEDEGPCEDHCPLSILKLLTLTDNEFALDWRKRCYEYHGKAMPLGQSTCETLF